MPPNRSPYQDAHSTQSFLQGINTMQMQAGLVPGGVYSGAPPIMPPPPRGPTTADFSNNLRVGFQQQQQYGVAQPMPMMGGVTPVHRPFEYEQSMMMNAPNLPPPSFGGPRGMAMQQQRALTNQSLANAQAGMGLGARMMGNAGAFAMGNAMGGPIGGMAGMTAFEHFGGGQMMQRMGSGMLNPLIENRANSLQLQSLSNGFVRGGPDMGMAGMGLSSGASSRLTHGLNQMAGSNSFQQQTDGMFNKQDVMKITNLAGQMGMLDQSQTADEIKQSVGKISRALTNFMKIAETPDVQEAMQMMGKMKAMGMDLPTTNASMRNARAFARMAGTDVQGVMQAGMQGAGTFQRMGMTAGAGLNAGMAAQGVAAQLVPGLTAQQQSLLGGQQGIAGMLTGGAASTASMRAMLPAMLTRQNGSLQIDDAAVEALMSGDSGSIQSLMQRSAGSMRRLGGADRVAQELATQSGELQSQLSDRLGGMGSVLMPMMMARMIRQGTPGMTDSGALRTLGFGDEQARAMELTMNSPEAMRGLREQARRQARESRRDIATERRAIREASETPQWVNDASRWGGRTGNRLSTNANDMMADYFDDEEFNAEVAAQGGGDVVGRSRQSRTDTRIQNYAYQDMVRQGSGSQAQALMGSRNLASQRTAAIARAQEEETMRNQGGIFGLAANAMTGSNGLFSDGMTETSVLRRNMGTTEYMRSIAGNILPGGSGMGGEERGRLNAQMRRTGVGIERARRSSFQDRDQRFAQILSGRTDEQKRAFSSSDLAGAMGTAATSLNALLDEKTGLITDERVTDGEIVSRVRSSLEEQGVPTEEINRMLEGGINSDAVQDIIGRGADTRSADAEQTLERAEIAGAEVNAQNQSRNRNVTRANADATRDEALNSLGVSTTAIIGMSRENQRGVLNAMSGAGQTGQARRLALAAKAARAAGNENVASRLEAQVTERFGSQALTTARAEVRALTQNMEEGELAGMGERLVEMEEEGGIGAVTRSLEEAGSSVVAAQAVQVEQSVNEMMGDDAYAALQGGGMDALKAYAEQGGDLGSLSERDRRRIQSGDMSKAELLRRGARRQEIGEEVLVAGGLTSEAEMQSLAGLDATIDGIQEGSRGSSQDRFVDSVDTFSQASEAMLDAARTFQDRDSLLGVGSMTRDAAGGVWDSLTSMWD